MNPELHIINRSRYHDIEVERLVRFAFKTVHDHWPVKANRLTIKVTNTCNHWSGWGYIGGRARDRDGANVCVRLGAPERFTKPQRISYDGTWKDMPVYYLKSYREALVYIAAHEFSHSHGNDGNKNGEMYCDFAGQDAVDLYRKQQAEVDGEIARRIAAVTQRVEATAQRHVARKQYVRSTEGKLEKCERDMARWTRKLKLAQTKLKRLRRSRSMLLRSAQKKLKQSLDTGVTVV